MALAMMAAEQAPYHETYQFLWVSRDFFPEFSRKGHDELRCLEDIPPDLGGNTQTGRHTILS